jgi:dolichol-phosphate mannosyltransferase
MKSVAVVIPAFNEESKISNVLSRLLPIVKNGDISRVVVVDDGSTDDTARIVRTYEWVTLVSYQPNKGRSAAINQGLQLVTEEWAVVFDADLEYEPEDLIPVIGAAIDNSIVYGSRYRHEFNYRSRRFRFGPMTGQSIGPWLANGLIRILVLLVYQTWYSEHFSGIRLYPTQFLQARTWNAAGFEGDHEKAAIAMRLGLKIIEVPIKYHPRSLKEGKKIRPRDGAIAVWTYMNLRFKKLSR